MIRDFLLGRLPVMEREPAEESFFADDDFFEAVVDAENDLFDAYIRGELEDADRRAFEQRQSIQPGGRIRIRFAQALADRVRDPGLHQRASSRPAWLLFSAVAALLAMTLAAGILWRQNRGLLGEVAELSAKSAIAGHLLTGAHAPGVVTVVLEPGLLRGASRIPEIRQPQGSQAIWMQLVADTDVPAGELRAELRYGSALVWWASGLRLATREGTPVVDALVPSSILKTGSYDLALFSGSAAQPVERYAFAMTK